jgi:hypothetical protein
VHAPWYLADDGSYHPRETEMQRMEQLSIFDGWEGGFSLEQEIVLSEKQIEELKQAMAQAITEIYRKEYGNHE